MKILALIPARGGSKRLPGKNIKPLGGIPLIAWSIRAAIDSGLCVDVVVSTDDHDITEIARRYGAHVPFLRPAKLASDSATSVDVGIHAIDQYEATNGPLDGVLLLQPTSPFRSVHTIKNALAMFEEHGGRCSVVSVSLAASHPAWCFSLAGRNLRPVLGEKWIAQRSQDLPPAYALNGAVYLISPDSLRKNQSYLAEDTLGLVVDNLLEAIDIDTDLDWLLAEAAVKLQKDLTKSVIQPNFPWS